MNESRTSKSIKNAQASLIYYFIQLLLGFFSRKVFFDYLGSEILGLNTTAANLLGFLIGGIGHWHVCWLFPI